jgi:protein gp37
MRLENIYVQWHGTSGAPAEAEAWPLPNVWLGVSVENQATANERIPLLLRTPAAVRFLSMEPLLGPVVLPEVFLKRLHFDGRDHNYPDGAGMIDWIIVGGESGPKARPMHPDWVRSLRDQCAAAGVPFLFKQWGEWAPALAGMWFYPLTDGPQFSQRAEGKDCFTFDDGAGAVRIGKTAAGRLLDGREWNEFPEVAR